MRVAIIGGGALGTLFGYKLSQAAGVRLVDRWARHVTTLNDRGVCVTRPDGTTHCRPLQATHVAQLHDLPQPVELLLICVKSFDTRQAVEQSAGLLAENGIVLTLQNGLGNLEVIAELVGPERAVQGVTAQGATLLGPGHVQHAGDGATHLATRPEVASQVEEIAALFQSCGLETHITANLEGLVWGKLVVNAGINALTAILRVPNGTLVHMPPARALMRAAVLEAAAVARAKGIRLPYADPVERVEEVAIATALNRSSMLQDILRGSATEVNAINQAVVQEGERLGIPTPVNRALAQLVQALEGSYETRLQGPGLLKD